MCMYCVVHMCECVCVRVCVCESVCVSVIVHLFDGVYVRYMHVSVCVYSVYNCGVVCLCKCDACVSICKGAYECGVYVCIDIA